MSVVISLCDLTGNMVQPWVEAGHIAVLVDPQHGVTRWDGDTYKLASTIEDAMPYLGSSIRRGDVAAVFGFPPCTDMAVSGARWFERKRAVDPMFQAKAVAVAEQCRTVGRLSGAPWFVENPVSVLARVFGKPDHYFDPCDYTAHEPADNYSKKTCLWAGGGFVMPEPQRDPTLGPPDDRIHRASPGPERENFRSATPLALRTRCLPGQRTTGDRRMIRPSTLIKHSPDRTPGTSGPDWMKDAACAGQIDDWAWFDHGKNDEPYALAEVRLSCDVCPVRAACLEYAIEHERDHGNWAGFTPKQRANIRRKRDRKSQAKGAA